MIRKYLAWVRDLTQIVLEPTSHSKLEIEACWLEDRLLYSATALPIEMIEGEATGLGLEISQAEIDAIMDCIDGDSVWARDLDADIPGVSTNELCLNATSETDAPLPSSVCSSASQTTARLEVAFIDSSLDNLQDLLDQWQSSYSSQDVALEIVLLDRQTSGIEQITNYLAASDHDYSSIHLVTHGSSGQFQLGSDWLNVETLDSHSQQLTMWQSSLTDDADLLVYACQVASTHDGQQLGLELAELLNVDVALSSDATGAAAGGGDWDLEFQIGLIETQQNLQVYSADEWDGLLATYTVTNTNNSGAGSLRQAILDANGNAGADTINFSIAAAGVNTITLSSALATITDQVTINATTESDFAGTPLIVINGGGTVATGLTLGSGSANSVIRGLVIQNFTGNGIDILSSGNWIAGNFIGTTSTGNVAAGNAIGINIYDAASNRIGGTSVLDRNVISGNTNIGINLGGTGSAIGNTISGNYIGVGANGTTDVGNRWFGVYANGATNSTIGGTAANAGNVISGTGTSGTVSHGIYLSTSASDWSIQGNTVGLTANGTGVLTNNGSGITILSSNNFIGGTGTYDGNIISGNTVNGITLTGTSANNNTVRGNYIGTSASGLADLGNTEDGIQLDSGASNNTIGGLTPGSRNIISGNNNAGIALNSAVTSDNAIIGNYIGLGSDGSTALGNTHNGVNVNTAVNTTIGSTNSAGRNIISSNTIHGIGTNDDSGTLIYGNYIGTDSTGSLARGNQGDGIRVIGTAIGVKIGGVSAGAGNVIANNSGDGILVSSSSSNAASILGNSIYSNAEQGIDLGNDDGLTSNDLNDSDNSSNGLQNYPRLKTAISSGGNTTITGAINTTSSMTYRVEFFSTEYGQSDSTGYGEARTYLGYTTVTTDSNGNAQFSASLTGVTLSTGATVTATATVDLGSSVFGATSEFAGNILANEPNLMVSGVYTGNGLDNRTIAALGFRPEVVLIMKTGSTSVIRTSTMDGDASKVIGGATALSSNMIQEFTSEGFVIGSNLAVNSSGTTFYWVAWGAGADIDVGEYVGTGSSQTIGGTGFAPDLTYVLSASATQAQFRTSQSTNTYDFAGNSPVTTGITGYTADGMTLGTSSTVNNLGTTYHYVNFNQSAGYFTVGNYTGNGSDNRSLSGVGFESEFLLVRATSGANSIVAKSESTGYNVDLDVYGSTNSIQALSADGFQVGTNAAVNANATNYTYMAFNQHSAPLIVDTTSDTSDGTVTSIENLRANKGADGKISLREAIAAANVSHNGTAIDEINFAISGSGVQTITVGTTGLANITDAVMIDASTQTGYSTSPMIELNGGNTGTLKDGFRLVSGSSGSTIRGFTINRFTGDGIEINSSNNHFIEGNWIGLNNTGTSASANANRGLYATNSTGITIGGTSTSSRNVISGNTNQGIYFDNVDNSYVYGNYVGTNAAGIADINGSTSNTAQSGLVLLNGSSGNLIGNSALSDARNVFSSNNHYGVEIQSATSINNTVSGNFIGTDATGLIGLGNVNGGFSFWGSGSSNLLFGNVVSANGGYGVLVGGAISSQIQGNTIGLGADGSTQLGNGAAGIYVTGAATNTLIGTNADGSNDTAERNVISANGDGILVDTAGTTGTMIYGNYIGTDATGLLARGNMYDGVRIESGATSNYIGGTGLARRNVIAANGNDGIQIDGESTDGNFIQNNYIGLASNGTTVLGNSSAGITITGGADNTTIGGVGLGNVIVGNGYNGIEINGASSGTTIFGNTIGINADGSVVAGNQFHGIQLSNGVSNTTIGGTTSGQGNTITANGAGGTYTNGINLWATGTGNAMVGNAIYGNAGIGIDIDSGGVTANDNLDADTGSNNQQNFPVISSANVNAAGTTVTVSGSINSLASVAGVVLHFYATPTNGNPNKREGKRYLGSSTALATDASGNVSFTNLALTGFTGTVGAGEAITATATYLSNTSEFSQGQVATLSTGNSAPIAEQVVSTIGGGVSLNSDGGTDAYLVSTSGLTSTLSAYTVEVKFAATDTGGDMPMISYNTAAGDQISIMVDSSNRLQVDATTNGWIASTATNYRSLLFDGQLHTISATWSNATGAWCIYVDGTLIDSGTGVAVGATVASGGIFVFGQEQDTSGGGFNSNERFSGTLYDARLFNTARSASQIQASYNSDLPRTETGLVANWKFDDLSEAGVVTEAVSGNNLTVMHVTAPGYTASTPTLTMQLNENSVTGTTVGSIYGTDIDREAKITALLAADPKLRYSAETDKFYKLGSSQTVFSNAQTEALANTLNSVAGQMVTIRTANENAIVQSMASAAGLYVWLGASDATSEGTWRWQTGSQNNDIFWQGVASGHNAGAYSNWNSAEPQNSVAGEDYAVLNTTSGRWNDTANGVAAFVVTEWNADDVLDVTNALTYTLISQTINGAFTINSDTGVITVADGTMLDYEAQATHTLNVRVSDGSGATYDRAFTVSLNNLTEDSAAPTDLSTGIHLNTDGGNDAYLMTSSGGTVFGGRTALTLEVSYSMLSNASSESPLISYAIPAGSDNEVYLRISPAGTISLAINGTVSSTSAPYATLTDGKQHAIAVSWDNTNGDVAFYVDGQFVQMNTGVKAGTTIAAGGTLVMGQDQDTVDGAYNSAQRFSGTLHDVRVWDRAISAEQISQNHQQKLGTIPTGLIADWRMTGFNGSSQVVDSVGGVNLSIGHATGTGFTTSNPTSALTLSENATIGTVVGTVMATDAMNARDIVADGLFREGTVAGVWTNYTAGQSFGGWTVDSGSVELNGTGVQSSPLGGRSIDLNGSAASGAISQTLSTVAGRQYQVVFALSGNFSGGEVKQDLRVSASGQSQDFSITQPTGWSASNMLWSNRSMQFTADSSSTTLSFASLDTASNCGANIADVRVLEIPAAVQKILSSDPTLTYDAATGKFYRYVSSTATWTTAQTSAIADTVNGIGGQLVTIRSEYENGLVYGLMRSAGTDIWIGATDATLEGTWRWRSGSTDSTTFWVGNGAGTLQSGQYANWFASEPDDFGGIEDLGIMRSQDGRWIDGSSGARPYIVGTRATFSPT